MKICIISACTSNYFNRLLILYQSLRKYHKEIYFHSHLINMEKDNQIEKIEDKYLLISYSNIETNNNNVIKNYASNVRSKLLHNLIHNYDKIFWFDADSIIRKSLKELFIYLDKNIIVAYRNFNPRYKYFTKGEFKTGIIGFKKCPIIIKFLLKWDYETFKNGKEKCFWFQDQILLTKLIIIFNKYLIIKNLPKRFIDWDFDDNSPIWVGKGEKKNEDKYLLEEKKISNSI